MARFTKAEKRRLNELFDFPARIGVVTIGRLSQEQGFENSSDFVNFWRNQLDERKREIKREKRRLYLRKWRDEKRRRESILLLNAILLSDVIDYIDTNRNNKQNVPFRFRMESFMNENIIYDREFKNIYHAKNAIAKFIDSDQNKEQYTDSSGLTVVYSKKINLWEYVTVDMYDLGGGSSNDRKETRVFIGEYNEYTVRQVRIRYNNCALEVLKHIFNITQDNASLFHSMRQHVKSQPNTLITIDQFQQLFTHFSPNKNDAYCIHTLNSDSSFIDGFNILLHDDHYYVINSIKKREFHTSNKVKHGVLTWDIETRPTSKYCLIKKEDGTFKKSYYIRDTILTVYVKDYKTDNYYKLVFITENEDSKNTSCRLFLNWLQHQNRNGKYYYCYAHNGGNFDLYFLLTAFNDDEKGKFLPTLRGQTIIKLEFGNNIFLDTYCFLIGSLNKLSNDFKVTNKKLTNFVINGKELTNEQLCFYKPHLTFNEFLNLQHTEPNFFNTYVEYCQFDTIALMEILEKFTTAVNILINKYVEAAPYRKNVLLNHCKLMQSCTIAGHANKILNSLNGVSKNVANRQNVAYTMITEFIDTQEKHDFLMTNFKRGGISHCNQKGKHCEGVMSVDICSQYPASLVNMSVPCGNSHFIYHYDDKKHGYYILKNLVFDSDYKFKPVCEMLESGILNWSTDKNINIAKLDTFTIKYLQQYYGLTSFEVVKGLVSDKTLKGSDLFGTYMSVLFNEKARQDELKKSGDPEYNNAMRETVKLYMNAISGKIVMDKSRYFGLKFSNEDDSATKNINGTAFGVDATQYSPNLWLVAGVQNYYYSKLLLFEYIRHLPNNSNDIIHVETDSLYFPLRCKDDFIKNIANYNGEFPIVKFGNELGNIKIECVDNTTCYFLNKKVYTIKCEGKQKFIWKGIPSKTIADDGTEIKILDLQKYIDVYNHKPNDKAITIEYSTLSKQLFGETRITTHRQTRALNSTHDYNEFH